MASENKLNLSEELKLFFKKSSDFSKFMGYKEIYISTVIYEIFKDYLMGLGKDKKLEKWMYDVKDKEGFLEKVRQMEDMEFTTLPDSYSSDDLILNKDVNDVLKSCQVKNNLIEDDSEITVSSFLSGVLTIPNKIGVKFSSILKEEGLDTSTLFGLSIPEKSVEELLGSLGSAFGTYSPIGKLMNSLMKNKSDSSLSSMNNKNDEFNEDDFEKVGESEAISSKRINPDSKTPYLDQFSFDMTLAAKEGKYDPVVGRDKEISQIIEILCCRKKNNAVLLGDPGCGKTAVVECLVQKINNKEVPRQLWNKRVCSLDLNALVSGTKYRGEYEQRLQEIIKEVCSCPEIIVYIDEFHNLVGNGGSAGNGDGANILKPYLARGEFQCIGSTTLDEYRKFIEKDGALKRRFQNVQVDEPTPEETLDILRNLRDKYSEYHKVSYSDDILKTCVDWSGRYINDRFFPDKAIDCMDMAGSLAKLNKDTDYSIIEGLEKELDDLLQEEKGLVSSLEFKEAKVVIDKRKSIMKKLEKQKTSLKMKEDCPKNWPEVSLENVASVVSKISNVPVDKINQTDVERMKGMKLALESKVIGQEEAVSNVVLNLQRNYLGLRDEKKPIATMLFVGPTGTGKSLICKEIAKEFFGSEKSLIRFDMGEFGERHEVTKLTGSTASYVGYEDTPLLEQVRRNPYSVVLFDEIEKAAPEIYNIFLNILDEGSVSLGNGTKVDFKNTIIIFTGNIGTKELAMKGDGIGFGSSSPEKRRTENFETVMKAVKKEFRPEFINRLSSITVFNELTKENMDNIFDLELNKLSERLGRRNLSLEVSKGLKEKIINDCDTKYGARDLQRNITKWIENEICFAILDVKSLDKVEKVLASLDKFGKVKIEFKKKKVTRKSKAEFVKKEECCGIDEKDSETATEEIIEEEKSN